ncbi:uncharacterized protein LOC143020917 [Oratosquilla oratoria]|uniref:uncharacterized protein LOC143020917 n=1 Tax=Oratosquilla oratoria TaxID=337810 RepID=UPI003F768B38
MATGKKATPTLDVLLNETPTLVLYDQENTSVHIEDPLAQEYIRQWNTYSEKKSAGQVRARPIACQTVPKYLMDKTTQQSATVHKSVGCWATQWDMYDEYQRIANKDKRPLDMRGLLGRRSAREEDTLYYGDIRESSRSSTPRQAGKREPRGVPAAQLCRGLRWVERLLSSTAQLELLQVFGSARDTVKKSRKHATVTAAKARLTELIQLKHPSTEGQRLNCICFLPSSPWLILATYGNLSFVDHQGGLLCGWNMKYTSQPEISLKLPWPATSVCTCPSRPNLCAVTLLDGTVRVYDLSTSSLQLLLDTSMSGEKHWAPVWQVEWRDTLVIRKEKQKTPKTGSERSSFKSFVGSLQSPRQSTADTAHSLVSVSEDGTVKEWLFTRDTLLRSSTILKIRTPLWLALQNAGGLEAILSGSTADPYEGKNLETSTAQGRTHPAGEQHDKEIESEREGPHGGRGEEETRGEQEEVSAEVSEREGSRKDPLSGPTLPLAITPGSSSAPLHGSSRDSKIVSLTDAGKSRKEKSTKMVRTKEDSKAKGKKNEEQREKRSRKRGKNSKLGGQTDGGLAPSSRGGRGGTAREDRNGAQRHSALSFLMQQNCPGTRIHFRPADETSYLVGTVSGAVLVCRTFQREGCSSVFKGHNELVTRVSWRGGAEDDPQSIFLSAALDETIKVWHLEKREPLCTLKAPQGTLTGYVDAQWSPWYGNLIAGCHSDGLELWDISSSTHSPLLSLSAPFTSALAFSPHTKNLALGDESGVLRLVHVDGIDSAAPSPFLRYSTALSRLARIGLTPEV